MQGQKKICLGSFLSVLGDNLCPAKKFCTVFIAAAQTYIFRCSTVYGTYERIEKCYPVAKKIKEGNSAAAA